MFSLLVKDVVLFVFVCVSNMLVAHLTKEQKVVMVQSPGKTGRVSPKMLTRRCGLQELPAAQS